MKEIQSERKKFGNRRGTGTIIAASFLVLIIISGYTLTVLLNTQTKELNEVIGEMNMLDWERGNERIQVIGNPFDPDDTLNITVENTGDVNVFLNWLTVRNASNLDPILDYSPTQILIRPGESVSDIGTNIDQEFLGGFEGTTSYVVQVLTSRGTVTSVQYPPLEQEYTPIINKIYSGPFEFSQDVPSFMYTSKDMDGNMLVQGILESNYTDNPTTPQPAYQLRDSYDHMVYSISFKNVENRTIEIHASSFLLIIVPQIGGTGETELYQYIVDKNSDSNGLIAYNITGDYAQSIDPGETGILKFASRDTRGTTFMYNNSLRGFQDNDPGDENLVTTYLIVFWRFQGTSIKFGQTIPLGSIHLNPEIITKGVHVVDLEGSSESLLGGDWRAEVEVTVHDSNDNPLEGARVRIEWEGEGSDSLYTGVSGNVTFTTTLDSSDTSVDFWVEDITEIEPESYTPSYNEDLDGDSDGTNLTIYKP